MFGPIGLRLKNERQFKLISPTRGRNRPPFKTRGSGHAGAPCFPVFRQKSVAVATYPARHLIPIDGRSPTR
jgi:hypothetical protein